MSMHCLHRVRVTCFGVCVYGSLARVCVIGWIILRAALNHCFQSLLPWQPEDWGIWPKYNHINLHFKGSCPVPPSLCLCVCFCSKIRWPSCMTLDFPMHYWWSRDRVSTCCQHYESCLRLYLRYQVTAEKARLVYWSELKINTNNILGLSSLLLWNHFLTPAPENINLTTMKTERETEGGVGTATCFC